MPLPGFPSNIVNWPWQVTPGLIEAKVFTFLDTDGDPYDPGTVTAKAKDGTISATVTGTGNTRTVTWSAEQTDLIPATQWRLNFDGHDQLGGYVGIAQPEDDADLTSEWTIQLPGDGDGLTITVNGGSGGSGASFAASMFVTGDDDFSGGTLTGITLYDTGDTVPREYVVTAPVCVVDGPDMGLWTITASGPCTPGRSIEPGDIIRAFSQGLTAIAGAADGETVTGINVTATYETVRYLSETVVPSLTAGVDALVTTVDGLGDEVGDLTPRVADLAKNASEAATGLALTAHANGMGTVWAWAECGWGDEPGDMVRGYWSCPVLLPTPTTSLFKRALVRSLSAPLENPSYQEIASEPMDSLGVPGDGGAWDHDEMWLLNDDGSISLGDEWTANGGTTEWHTDQDPVVDPPYGPGIPPGLWVEVAVAVPDFSDGILLLLGRTDHGTYIDPWTSDKWRILQTFDLGEPFTMEDTTAVEMWIGRGGGRFDIARVRRWIDDVLVSDFNPFMAGNGATTIADQVLVDENDDPAIWTASDNAVNVNND